MLLTVCFTSLKKFAITLMIFHSVILALHQYAFLYVSCNTMELL